MRATKQQDLLPILSLLLGATMWGIVWYPMRLLNGIGVDGLWQTAGISLPPAIIMCWTLVRYRDAIRKSVRPLLGLAIAGWWVNAAFILAVLDGNILRVLLLFYLSPLWATLLGVWVLKERFTRQSLLMLAVAACGGALMLLKPGAISSTPITTADWLALSSGIAFAFHNLFVRMAQHAPVALKSEISWIGGVVGSVAAIVLLDIPAPPINTATVLGVFAVGTFGLLIMTLLVQYGVTHMPVQRSAVILLFELVAGAISQQLLTEEVMMVQEWIGGALIIAAAVLAARAAR